MTDQERFPRCILVETTSDYWPFSDRHSLYVCVTAVKHPVPDRLKPSFVIFDIQALWRPDRQSARMSKITNERLNPV